MRLNIFLRRILLIIALSSLVYLSSVLMLFAIPAGAASAEGSTLPVDESPLNPTGFVYELNLGPDGSLWISDRDAGEILRYDASGNTLHVFSGMGTVSDARAAADGGVWYVDQDNNRLGRLQPDTNRVDLWNLPPEAVSGFGTALDGQGRVWTSDFTRASLYRYDTTSSKMCSFDTSVLADGGSPYLAVEGRALWLSDFYSNAVLRLDLQTYQLTRWKYYSALDWDFEAEGLSGDGAGGLWFADSNGASLGRLDLSDQQAPRLLRYRLPAGNTEPIMLVRQGKLVLYSGLDQVTLEASLGLFNPARAIPDEFDPEVSSAILEPACETLAIDETKMVTFDDRIPKWGTSFYDLSAPDPAWQMIALPENSYPFGVAMHDNHVWVVDNGRDMLLHSEIAATVTACGLDDKDGKLETENDRSPLPDLAVALRVEGVRQKPKQITGANGCYTWTDLSPLIQYGLEAAAEGRNFLTPTQIDFDSALAGGSQRFDFILAAEASTLYLPVVIR